MQLAVWAYIMSTGRMHHTILLRRDIYIWFNTHTCPTLKPVTPFNTSRGELVLEHPGDRHGALAFTVNPAACGVAYYLRYTGTEGVSLSADPQLLEVFLGS